MQAVVIAVITTLIGIIFAVLVSRHYYRVSIKHRLSVYSTSSPGVFYGVDPEVRQELSIQFRGNVVKQLNVTEFLVANEGADAIRRSIEPLTFHLGDEAKILDAAITYVQPDGREIDVKTISEHEFRCNFPLLNPNEYFYVKVIADGAIRRSSTKCSIVAENLPPRIPVENATKVSIGPHEDRRDPALLAFAGVFLLIGAILTLPLVGLYQAHPADFPFAWSKFHFSWWLTIPVFISGIIAGFSVIISLVLGVGAFFGDIPPRPHFKGPRRPPQYIHGIPPFPDSESALERHPREQEEA